MKPDTHPPFLFPALVACFLFCGSALAVDTLEPFAPGLSDAEFYLGADGIGRASRDMVLQGAFLLGAGITSRLSGYLDGAAGGDGHLTAPQGSFGGGLFGTAVDTRRFDLDWFAGLSLSHPEPRLTTAAGVELNLDFRGAGLFLVVQQSLCGAPASIAPGPRSMTDEGRFTQTDVAAGVHVTPADGHQLLALWTLQVRHEPDTGATTVSPGSTAIGYNVQLTENLELINELALAIPTGAGPVFLSATIGIIATLSAD